MKRTIKSLIVLVVVAISWLSSVGPGQVHAASMSCGDIGTISVEASSDLGPLTSEQVIEEEISSINLNIGRLTPNQKYTLYYVDGFPGPKVEVSSKTTSGSNLTFSINENNAPGFSKHKSGIIANDDKYFELANEISGGTDCTVLKYFIKKSADSGDCSIILTQNGVQNASCYDSLSPITVNIDNLAADINSITIGGDASFIEGNEAVSNGSYSFSFNPVVGSYTMKVFDGKGALYGPGMCNASFAVQPNECTIQEPLAEEAAHFNLCDQIPAGQQRSNCQTCLGNDGIWTAVGCVHNSTEGIVGKFISVGLGLAGGVALIMILAAGFMLSTSQGEPKRTSEAKEILTSAIIGLLFIIFSVTILQFIGVTIFRLPEFGA